MKTLILALLTLVPLAAQNSVSLIFTVQDRKGRFIADLGKDDFEIVENKKPQAILDFTAESNLPLRLAILIDTGNNVRDRFQFQQDAAIEFIDRVVRPGPDQFMVMRFNAPPELVADLTDSREKLGAAVRNLRSGGGSALYEALAAACSGKLALQPGEPPEKYRRAVVLLSAGEDSQSAFTRDQALEMAQKADAVIYTISNNNTKAETNGDKVLKYFAQETGGQSFFPAEAEDLGQPFENIANELRHQYRLVFRGQKSDGAFHPIEIRLKTHKDLTVRARRGYYASAEPAGK